MVSIFTAEVQHPLFKLELSQCATVPCNAGQRLRPEAGQNFPDIFLLNSGNILLRELKCVISLFESFWGGKMRQFSRAPKYFILSFWNYLLVCSLRKKSHGNGGVTQPDPPQNQVLDLTLCLLKYSQHRWLPADRPGWDITRGSWSWKSHWFHLRWKVLHAPLGFSAAFVQESFRHASHYVPTLKHILQPWITNADSPVLRHYISAWSYQLAVIGIQI